MSKFADGHWSWRCCALTPQNVAAVRANLWPACRTGPSGAGRGLARVLRPVTTRFHGTLELPPYMRNHAEGCVAITSSAALIVQ
jgi:hypothetical protein